MLFPQEKTPARPGRYRGTAEELRPMRKSNFEKERICFEKSGRDYGFGFRLADRKGRL